MFDRHVMPRNNLFPRINNRSGYGNFVRGGKMARVVFGTFFELVQQMEFCRDPAD